MVASAYGGCSDRRTADYAVGNRCQDAGTRSFMLAELRRQSGVRLRCLAVDRIAELT